MLNARDERADGLSAAIRLEARKLGADLVGIAPVERWDDPPPFDAAAVHVYPHSGYRPAELLPRARAVIVVAVRYLDGLMAHLTTGARTTSLQNNFGYIHLNRRLHQITYELAHRLEDGGHAALPLGYNIGSRWDTRRDTEPGFRGAAYGLFSMKRAAVLAGIGRSARNGLVATAQYGTRVRLGAVITTAALDGDPMLAGSACPPHCKICVRVCPSDALERERPVDHLRCYADCGRMGTRYDDVRAAFERRYPRDAPGVDTTGNDFLAIDGNGPRYCKLACITFCPLGERRLPEVWRAARHFRRNVPKVPLEGFPD
ncbi:MAG: epoxyqueuosine reductase [Burkholderiales bacterium]|nr:epoxyqueuosine reductase [Burkholderiales bacterium]